MELQYRISTYSAADCFIAPFSPDVSHADLFGDRDHFVETHTQALAESMTEHEPLLSPLYGIESQGQVQIFKGGYQFEAYKLAFPDKPIPIRLGQDKSFTTKEIVQILLTDNGGPEQNPLTVSKTIAGITEWLGMNDREISECCSLKRNKITYLRRLSSLHPEVKRRLALNKISYSVARELISVPLDEQESLVKEITERGMDITRLRRRLGRANHKSTSTLSTPATEKGAQQAISHQSEFRRWEEYYSEGIGYPVKIVPGQNGGGELVISAFDRTGFEAVIDLLNNAAISNTTLRISFKDLDHLDEVTSGMVREEDF